MMLKSNCAENKPRVTRFHVMNFIDGELLRHWSHVRYGSFSVITIITSK